MAIFKSKKQKDIVIKLVKKQTSHLEKQLEDERAKTAALIAELDETRLEEELNITTENGVELSEDEVVEQAFRELNGIETPEEDN